MFEKAKQKTFPVKTFSFTKKNTWYDSVLNRAKKRYALIRKKKHKQLNKAHGKFYKKLLISKARAHSEKVQTELRSLKVDDPKVYWNTLKAATKAKSDCSITPEEFENHFKELNEKTIFNTDTSSQSQNPNNPLSPNTQSDSESNDLQTELLNELNKPIAMDELTKALKNLKNNKATGPDGIKNEEIKSSFEMMKGFYLKLFNLIFDSGVFPSSWAEGLIVPIYKKRGARETKIIIGALLFYLVWENILI